MNKDEQENKPEMVPVNGPLLLGSAPLITIFSGLLPLGILLVAGLWWSLKDKSKLVDYVGRSVLNHQITWGIAFVILLIFTRSLTSNVMIAFWVLWFILTARHLWMYIEKDYLWKSPVSFPFLKYKNTEEEEDDQP